MEVNINNGPVKPKKKPVTNLISGTVDWGDPELRTSNKPIVIHDNSNLEKVEWAEDAGNALHDFGSSLLHGISTFGGSLIGDAVNAISPRFAEGLSRTTLGLVSPTPESVKTNLAQASNKERLSKAASVATEYLAGEAGGHLAGKALGAAVPVVGSAVKKGKETVKKTLSAVEEAMGAFKNRRAVQRDPSRWAGILDEAVYSPEFQKLQKKDQLMIRSLWNDVSQGNELIFSKKLKAKASIIEHSGNRADELSDLQRYKEILKHDEGMINEHAVHKAEWYKKTVKLMEDSGFDDLAHKETTNDFIGGSLEVLPSKFGSSKVRLAGKKAEFDKALALYQQADQYNQLDFLDKANRSLAETTEVVFNEMHQRYMTANQLNKVLDKLEYHRAYVDVIPELFESTIGKEGVKKVTKRVLDQVKAADKGFFRATYSLSDNSSLLYYKFVEREANRFPDNYTIHYAGDLKLNDLGRIHLYGADNALETVRHINATIDGIRIQGKTMPKAYVGRMGVMIPNIIIEKKGAGAVSILSFLMGISELGEVKEKKEKNNNI